MKPLVNDRVLYFYLKEQWKLFTKYIEQKLNKKIINKYDWKNACRDHFLIINENRKKRNKQKIIQSWKRMKFF